MLNKTNIPKQEISDDCWNDLASLDTDLVPAKHQNSVVGGTGGDLVLYFPVDMNGFAAHGPVFVGKAVDSRPGQQVVETPNGNLLEEPLATVVRADSAAIRDEIARLRRFLECVTDTLNKLERAMQGEYEQSSAWKDYQSRFKKKKSELGRLEKAIQAYQTALDLVGRGEVGWSFPDHPVIKRWKHTIPGFAMP